MTYLKNKAIFLFISLATGCHPMVDDSSITGTETKNNKKPANNESNASPSIKSTMQDLNKSYYFMDRPWVLAKPLWGETDLNISKLFYE